MNSHFTSLSLTSYKIYLFQEEEEKGKRKENDRDGKNN